MATSITTIQSNDYQDASRTDINNNFDSLNQNKVEKGGDTMTGLLQFSGTTHAGVKVNSLTTVQRDALTGANAAANGMIIYNSTASAFQIYENGSWTNMIALSRTLTAGEAISAGQAIYIDASDGLAYKCNSSNLAKIGFFGFASTAASALGQTFNVQISGVKSGFSSLTIGARYFLSDSVAGGITVTPPTTNPAKDIGVAISTTEIHIERPVSIKLRTYTSSSTWTKPAGLKYIEVELVGGGNGGSVGNNSPVTRGSCGTGSGYSRKRIYASSLSSTETVTVGVGGNGGVYPSPGPTAGTASSFGSHLSASPSSQSGGDLNLEGNEPTGSGNSGAPGPSFFGQKYGGGGTGGQDGVTNGTNGKSGIVLVTEYF